MLELRTRHSILSPYENRPKNIYTHNLKKLVQRVIVPNYTIYFFSFFSFKILHRFIKSFVIPTPNRVYSSSKSNFLKSDSKNLKNLNFERLQTKQTIIHTRKPLNVPKDIITFLLSEGFRSPILTLYISLRYLTFKQFQNNGLEE